MSVVFFYDPDMESYVVVPYRDTSHPAVSLWEFRELKKKATELNPNQPVDEDAIFEARARMARVVDESARETKLVRRRKQKEVIRKKESIPSISNMFSMNKEMTQVLNPAFESLDDEDFEDIKPFEDIEQ